MRRQDSTSNGRAPARLASLVLASVLVGCAARRAAAPVPAPRASAGGVAVTLAWTDAVDLDLYVTDPALETVYYANPRSRSGGVLERDARCEGAKPGGQSEQARWTNPPPGRYRVGVDFPEACGARPSEATYRLVVEIDGTTEEVSDVARVGERRPQVLTFTVTGPTVREETK